MKMSLAATCLRVKIMRLFKPGQLYEYNQVAPDFAKFESSISE